jgi:hypothetical protein
LGKNEKATTAPAISMTKAKINAMLPAYPGGRTAADAGCSLITFHPVQAK